MGCPLGLQVIASQEIQCNLKYMKDSFTKKGVSSQV